MFNKMLNFFIEIKLISSNQSGFKSRISFNVVLEVRDVFFDISKAFDRVWHDGIIYKLT